MLKKFFLLVGFIGLTIQIAQAQHKPLSITIDNIHQFKGKLLIGIYDSEKLFPQDGKFIRQIVKFVDGSSKTILVNDLKPGNYAIALFHDVNNDGVINKNWVGIPTEPYAFSKNYAPKLTPPSFNQVKFSYPSESKLRISLIH